MDCPICNKRGRADNIKRHIALHKKEICTLMTPANITHCKDATKPVLFIQGKMMYCLICKKLATSPRDITDMCDAYIYTHKNCCKQFHTVARNYIVIDRSKNELIMDPKPEILSEAEVDQSFSEYKSTRNEIVSEINEVKQSVPNLQADLALIAQVRKLEDMLENAESAYEKEQQKNESILSVLDQLKNIAVHFISDEGLKANINVFNKVYALLAEEEDDEEDDDE